MRALVLSGGGHKGAFQVGAIQHLVGDLKLPYKIFCGVSVGAINAAHLSMYNETQSIKAATSLLQLWDTLKTPDVAERWFPFGKLHGLWETGMMNTQPLREMLTRLLERTNIYNAGNKLIVGATSLNTGIYRTFDERYPQLIEAIMASAAFPGIFPSVKLEGEEWIDGGVRTATPLKAAIDAGATKIDVVLTEPMGFRRSKEPPSNAIKILLEAVMLMSSEVFENDVKIAQLVNRLVLSGASDKKVIEINIIDPSKPLPGDLLEFDPEISKQLIAIGFNRAKYLFKG